MGLLNSLEFAATPNVHAFGVAAIVAEKQFEFTKFLGENW